MKKTFTEKINYRLSTVLLCLLLAIVINTASAQNDVTIRGHVTDSKGLQLPGVSVKLIGTAQGTVTDVTGSYKITASKTSRLQFSFIGYVTKTEEVGNRAQIDVVLADDVSKALNEVVVVGYGTQKRSDITGSVTTVPKARLEQLPVTNVMQAVEGAVAGITVSTTSMVPGRQPSVTVRGQNSITAGTQGPFIVVDGIPLTKSGGSLNDINPQDIASMEILKDASATAIYGANGSQGVILITTKRGTSGKPVIRYSGYAGYENISHLLTPRDPASFTQKFLDYESQNKLTQQFPEPVYNNGERANYAAGRTVDWVKETTQQGFQQDHNLSISGGSPDVKYFISGDYLKEKGVVKGYQYNRASFRSNLDINVTSFLTMGANVYFANNNYDGGRANLLYATAMSPYGSVYNPDGTYMIYPQLAEQLYTNPLLGLTTDQVNRSVNVSGNGYAQIKFGGALQGLSYRLNAGYTYLPTRIDSYSGRLANTPLGAATATASETNSYTLDNLLYYDREFGKHHISFTGLYSAMQRRYFISGFQGTGYINDALSFNDIGVGSTISGLPEFSGNGTYSDRYALESQMARLNYTYNSKYLLTLTVRRDGSSVFGGNTDKHGWFPSVALGWNISNEDFMKNLKAMNTLKLRASYGRTGNEAIGVYSTITSDGTVRFPFNGTSNVGVQASNLGNGNLHWETTTQANIAADFGLFNSRINGTLEYYDSRTSGLLLSRTLPAITGYGKITDNIGKVANKGVELTLNTRNVDGRAFKWESTVVFAVNKNKLIDLYGDGKDDVANGWFIGQPIKVIYDYKMQGVWQTGEDASKQDPGAKPGDLKFADTNGDGKITADDRVIQGQRSPKWTGGLTNTFHYKNLSLNVFIQTAQGILKNDADFNYADESGRRNTPAAIGYWTPTNGSQEFQALSYTNPRGYGYPRDASYTRIKDVTLSYVFPAHMLEKAKIAGLTLYLSGRNLHTFTKWIGWDPEDDYSTRGSGDFVNNYPQTRTIVLGANISLK
ncbi:SusC/RagA family TonB-linked outer membrane protein [Mucilaginibacter boryungensis]|uniref:TonB-dependent receptor n=1 Tax=Mucilaginibacter boryungensis TaxID=768480 RepID=A0ABR9XEF4_9SPHI|nr:TonB-dependent receptor [Mucilaginibacter boryungensis]MBE9665772.1 TonB-dependent receptor [Mucilaginibacter boryungensis]